MNIIGRTKIYRNDFDGKPTYSRCIASKKYEGGQTLDEWVRAYQRVQFPKGTDIPDRSMVDIKHGFETVYEGKNGATVKLVVMDFEVVEGETPEAADVPSGFMAVEDNDIPF